jgi:hypothetical protein
MTQVPASSHGGSAFNGGAITAPTSITASGNPVAPLIVSNSDSGGSDALEIKNSAGDVVFGVATSSHANTSDQVSVSGPTSLGLTAAYAGFNPLTIQGSGGKAVAISDTGVVDATLGGGAKLNPITSGALPTVAPVSTTPFQCSTTRDVFLLVPFTGDATNNAATCKVEVSPDNVTYSTLNTVSIAAALNLSGALDISIEVWVPAGWRVKLTSTHGTLGTGTYY